MNVVKDRQATCLLLFSAYCCAGLLLWSCHFLVLPALLCCCCTCLRRCLPSSLLLSSTSAPCARVMWQSLSSLLLCICSGCPVLSQSGSTSLCSLCLRIVLPFCFVLPSPPSSLSSLSRCLLFSAGCCLAAAESWLLRAGHSVALFIALEVCFVVVSLSVSGWAAVLLLLLFCSWCLFLFFFRIGV